MKAVRMHTSSGPDVLDFEAMPVPILGFGDALVKEHAAGVTQTVFPSKPLSL